MSSKQKYVSSLMPNKMLPILFNGIESNLVKNVHIMRIMDLN